MDFSDKRFVTLENNIVFFDRLYILIGVKPYIEKPENFYIDDKYKYNNLMKVMFKRLNDFYHIPIYWTWDRECEYYKADYNGIPLIEYKIKDWIVNFLEKTREEWVLSLTKKSLEERNLRLLNEIEDLLSNK